MASPKPEFKKGDEVGYVYTIPEGQKYAGSKTKRKGKVVAMRFRAVWEYKLEGENVNKEEWYQETELVWY